MKRNLTITFEFEDGPWCDSKTGLSNPTDAVAFAMDQVNGAILHAAGIEFVDAKLDGELLADRTGYVSAHAKTYTT